MAITLPSSLSPRRVSPFLLDFGAVLTPFAGGPSQRINRLGMRLGAQVTMPPLRSDREGPLLVSRLVQARSDELLLDCPLVDGSWTSAGTPLVRVAVTGGTTLQIKGLPAGYALDEGRIFSLVRSATGRRYVHGFAAQGTADGSGNATASVWPPMRTSFAVNDVIELATPKMQGHVVDDQLGWEMALARRTSLSFTVHESQ